MSPENPFLEIARRLDAIESVLLEIRAGNKPAQRVSQNVYLTAREAAKYLRLSRQHLYKLTMTKSIAFTKKHKALLFRTEDLDQWLASGKNVSNPA